MNQEATVYTTHLRVGTSILIPFVKTIFSQNYLQLSFTFFDKRFWMVKYTTEDSKFLNLYDSILYHRRRQWHPTPVLLPGKSHGRRSLEGCSPWVRWGSDTTEPLHFDFSLSCIGEGNGNPLQCSCLENPRDRGPGGLPSMGSHRVRHDWSDLAAAAAV